MIKKLSTLVLLIGLSTLSVYAQKEYGLKFSSLISDNLTLENAIRLGLENNSSFLTAQQEIIIAEQKVNEAKFRYLPQFSLQGTATWYDLDYPMVLPDSVANRFIPGKMQNNDKHFYGVGVTGTQYLYSGGRIQGTLKAARANLKQIQSRFESVKNAIVLDIKKSFITLLYAQENTRLTRELWQEVSTWKTPTGTSLWTQIQTKSLLSQLRVQLAHAEKEQAAAQLALLTSLNKELNAPLTVTGTLEPVSLKEDLAHYNLWATQFRPELKTAIYALELDSISIDLALSKRYPDIILNASYEKLGTQDLDDENKQVSLAVRLPIPYNFSEQIIQKRAEQRKSELKRAHIEDSIRIQVAQRFANMQFWQQETLQQQQDFQTVSALFKRATQQHPKLEVASLQAAQAYLQTLRTYLQALLENNLAKAELEWAIGKDL